MFFILQFMTSVKNTSRLISPDIEDISINVYTSFYTKIILYGAAITRVYSSLSRMTGLAFIYWDIIGCTQWHVFLQRIPLGNWFPRTFQHFKPVIPRHTHEHRSKSCTSHNFITTNSKIYKFKINCLYLYMKYHSPPI